MNPSVSICMTTYNRPYLLERTLRSIFSQEFRDYEVIVVDDGSDTETPQLCEHYPYPVRYFKRRRVPGTHYSNPAVPNNIAIQMALGTLIILQNAECLHRSPEVIKAFLDHTKEGTALFAKVEALTPDGNHQQWYTHPIMNRRPFFFCGAVHRSVFLQLRGFDEDYLWYGFDDDDMAYRMEELGIQFEFSNTVHVHHQWHPIAYKREDAERNAQNAALYRKKSMAMKTGTLGIERNVGRKWGVL